jgi:hypothetical protein
MREDAAAPEATPHDGAKAEIAANFIHGVGRSPRSRFEHRMTMMAMLSPGAKKDAASMTKVRSTPANSDL